MTNYRAFVVNEIGDKSFAGQVEELGSEQLPPGEVLISVEYSSINYKDALSASGNKAVTRTYPHTPGIDAAGLVVASDSAKFKPGDKVIVTGYDLGMNTAGGFGQLIRVPLDWVVRLPSGLSLRESMILGTAGFTAALCVKKLLLNGLHPEQGQVVVTGATGGVGIVALALLSKLGFEVVASTGKTSAGELLTTLGAASIIDRAELSEANSKPLLKPRWAGAVDVVGGDTLSNVIKSLQYGASVAACGLVQSPGFQASVLPFILRGVNLLGIDSVELDLAAKQSMWDVLGADWHLDKLDILCHEIGFEQLDESLQTVLSGGASGRYLLNLRP